MYHRAMFRLTERRFVDYFNDQPETGMGYSIATAFLKDGRIFVAGDRRRRFRDLSSPRTYGRTVPAESDVDHFVVTHDKWKW